MKRYGLWSFLVGPVGTFLVTRYFSGTQSSQKVITIPTISHPWLITLLIIISLTLGIVSLFKDKILWKILAIATIILGLFAIYGIWVTGPIT